METELTKSLKTEGQEILQPELIIRPQTVDEEYTRIKFYLNKLPWYTEHGY